MLVLLPDIWVYQVHIINKFKLDFFRGNQQSKYSITPNLHQHDYLLFKGQILAILKLPKVTSNKLLIIKTTIKTFSPRKFIAFRHFVLK